MGSNSNNITNGTSFQPSEPAPCANGCGFFGSPATNGFCSKCFRDARHNEEQSSSAKAAVDKLVNLNSQPSPYSSIGSEPVQQPPAVSEPVQQQLAVSEPLQLSVVSEPGQQPPTITESVQQTTVFKPVQGSQAVTEPVQGLTGSESVGVNRKVLNRCLLCNKKVGVMGFKCKCGETFCGSHRYPEKHDCGFDFKRTGRNYIARANPVVRADKMNRI